MEARRIETVEDLIAEFGGASATARALGTTPQAVVNWRARGYLPARSYLIQRDALLRRGIQAPASLWGIQEAAA